MQDVFMKPTLESFAGGADEGEFNDKPLLWAFFTWVVEELKESGKLAAKNPTLCRQLLKRQPSNVHRSRTDIMHEVHMLYIKCQGRRCLSLSLT